MRLKIGKLIDVKTISYLIIAFIVVLPFLSGKYLFMLDHIPKLNDYGITNLFYGKTIPQYGGSLPLSLLGALIPAAIFQKIFLFLILFLAGYSMHTLAEKITESRKARFYAGLLYMLNPYVYVRILAGHWLILFAYAVLPLAVKSFIDLMEDRSRKNIIKAVFLTSLVGFNSHTLVMAFIAYFVIFCFKVYRDRDMEVIKMMSIMALFFLLLNSYWLLPLATAKETIISSIGSDDLAVFAPRIESFSALFTLASMHGFWRGGYVFAKDFIPYWQVLFAFILFLAVHGFLSYYRARRIGIYVKAFGIIGVLGLILAAGINSPFSETFRWLFDNTPFMKGMRDSHKFVTLLVLAYAYLGALGVAEIGKGMQQKGKKRYLSMAVIALALATPFVYSFTFFNGFAGQIKAGDYPGDWYEVNNFLNDDKGDFRVLFFPWHMYMDFRWIPNREKRIANPAQHFFNREVISGKNVEIGRIYRQVNSPEQLYVDFLLKNKDNITNFGNLIAPLNVKYILLTKEVDYKKYFFLFNQTDLKLVKETENFYVFKNTHEVSKVYEVNCVSHIKNWSELLERSRTEDITDKLYLIGNSPANVTAPACKKRAVGYEKESPVKYELKEEPLMKYLVFTQPYSESWVLGGKKPIKAYGVVNAYEIDGSGSREIRYERFYRVYLPAYAISILTFLALIFVYLGFVRFR